jgi:hypothetical protein
MKKTDTTDDFAGDTTFRFTVATLDRRVDLLETASASRFYAISYLSGEIENDSFCCHSLRELWKGICNEQSY